MENIFQEPTVGTLLEERIHYLNKTLVHYRQNSQAIIKELKQVEPDQKRPYKSKFIIDLRWLEKLPDPGIRTGVFIRDVLNATPDQIILVSAGLFQDRGMKHQRVLKKGELCKISRAFKESSEDALYHKLLGVRDESGNLRGGVETGTILVGYDWKGHDDSNKRFRVTTLVDCFKGRLLDKHLNKKRIATPIDNYSGNIENRGATEMVVHGIPSLSSNTTYTVRIRNVAAFTGQVTPEMIHLSYDLDQHHGRGVGECEKSKWYTVKDDRGINRSKISGRRTGKEILFDFHAVTAFRRVMSYFKRRGFNVINPLVEPERIRSGEYLFNKLGKVIKEEKQEGGKIRRYHLDNMEREAVLWQLVDFNYFLNKHGKRRRRS